MEPPISFAVLTVSDRCSRGEAVDKSGPNLELLITKNKDTKGSNIKERNCVPDDKEKIIEILRYYSSEDSGIDVVLTTGGTGFAPRDVTPEATKFILDKEAPAITIAITEASLSSTPFAMLYRGICGIRNRTIIINLPGSVRGSSECFEVVAPVLNHAVSSLRDDKENVAITHEALKITSKVIEGNAADRPRQSPWPMLSVEESQKIVLSNLPKQQSELVHLTDALHRILAEDVLAKDPLPPFSASIKDGYAVMSKDGKSNRKVVGCYDAGMDPSTFTVKEGECVRVNTGSPIPKGADSIIQVEDTSLISWDTKEELEISVHITPAPGLDIRQIGSDIEQNEMVLRKFSPLGSSELGLLAAIGVSQIPVFKSPLVSVISTGNELLEPSSDLKPGMIRDCNKTTLMALLKENGFTPLDMGIARDRPSDLLRALLAAMECSDFVVTTGSVSMGDKDFLKKVLEADLRANIHFGRVNMKPGKPTTFATCTGLDGNHKAIFCLPGNPVSATVTCHLYVLPALRKTGGHTNPLSTKIKVRLAEDIKLDVRPEFKRVILDWSQEDGVPLARITGNQISSRLLSCRNSNCLLVLPPSVPECTTISAQSLVQALIVGSV